MILHNRIDKNFGGKLLRFSLAHKLALLSAVKHVESALGTNVSMEQGIFRSILEFAQDRRQIIFWN